MDEFSFNCDILALSEDNEDVDDEEFICQLTNNVIKWMTYCRLASNDAPHYYRKQQRRIRRFPFARNGHMFMKEAMEENAQLCYQEFRMYPPQLRQFAHTLRDDYGLCSSQRVDIYEKVGMFLCILAHGKGYRQVNTIFNHSLQTICQYFKDVLRAVVSLSARLIQPRPNYNDGADPHRPDPNKHPLFENCIGAIDGTHVKAVLPRHEWVNFIGRKGVSTQNVLAICDFNLCFTFVLAGFTRNTHDARILARAIHSPEISFPEPTPGKYYLVDSGFAHRPGYMAPYKGSDILYHFQAFRDDGTGRRRRFRNARERFNYKHSSCKNVIEHAFGVWKERWQILDRMPSYSFCTQTVVVVATMGIHNFQRRSGVVDPTFRTAETDEDAFEVDLPTAEDEMHAEIHAPEMHRSEWDMFRDYMAQQQ